jgi:hypothetical protein
LFVLPEPHRDVDAGGEVLLALLPSRLDSTLVTLVSPMINSWKGAGPGRMPQIGSNRVQSGEPPDWTLIHKSFWLANLRQRDASNRQIGSIWE